MQKEKYGALEARPENLDLTRINSTKYRPLDEFDIDIDPHGDANLYRYHISHELASKYNLKTNPYQGVTYRFSYSGLRMQFTPLVAIADENGLQRILGELYLLRGNHGCKAGPASIGEEDPAIATEFIEQYGGVELTEQRTGIMGTRPGGKWFWMVFYNRTLITKYPNLYYMDSMPVTNEKMLNYLGECGYDPLPIMVDMPADFLRYFKPKPLYGAQYPNRVIDALLVYAIEIYPKGHIYPINAGYRNPHYVGNVFYRHKHFKTWRLPFMGDNRKLLRCFGMRDPLHDRYWRTPGMVERSALYYVDDHKLTFGYSSMPRHHKGAHKFVELRFQRMYAYLPDYEKEILIEAGVIDVDYKNCDSKELHRGFTSTLIGSHLFTEEEHDIIAIGSTIREGRIWEFYLWDDTRPVVVAYPIVAFKKPIEGLKRALTIMHDDVWEHTFVWDTRWSDMIRFHGLEGKVTMIFRTKPNIWLHTLRPDIVAPPEMEELTITL